MNDDEVTEILEQDAGGPSIGDEIAQAIFHPRFNSLRVVRDKSGEMTRLEIWHCDNERMITDTSIERLMGTWGLLCDGWEGDEWDGIA